MGNKISNIQQLAYFDIAIHGNQAWFCNYLYASVFRMDLSSHKINLETFIPNKENYFEDLYGPIAYYKGNLILAPRRADRILLYNLSQKTFREIPVSMDVMEQNQRYSLFMDIIVVEDTAYILPCRYPAVLKLNLNTFHVTYYDAWYQELKKSLCEPQRFVFGRAAVRNEHECLFPAWQDNLLMQFDLKTGDYIIHRIFDWHIPFSAAAFDGESYWIVPRNKNMFLRWEKKKGIVIYDDFPPSFKMQGEVRFVSLECIGEEIIAVPRYGSGNMIVAINRGTGKIRKIRDVLTSPVRHLEESAFGQGVILCSKKTDDGKLIVFSDFDGKTLNINLEDGGIDEFETVLEGELLDLYVQHILFGGPGKILMENKDVSLAEYIRYFNLCEPANDNIENDEMAGKKIFGKINSFIKI